MSKTYKKDSRHNKYDEKWAYLNLRVEQDLRMKIEKLAKQHDVGIAAICRIVLEESVKEISLTPEDYKEIARRMEVNKERNDNRG